MSDHRLDTLDRDVAGAPSVTLDEAKAMCMRRWQSDGLVREPVEPDEQGALLVRVPLFSTERIAYFERSGRAVLLFLDGAVQPRAHAPGAEHPRPAPVRQSGTPRQSHTGDAGPLFGSPGCAAPDCARPQETVQRVADARAMPALRCSACGAKPKPDTVALEGGPHRIVHTRHDASRPRQAFLRTAVCGKWRRA